MTATLGHAGAALGLVAGKIPNTAEKPQASQATGFAADQLRTPMSSSSISTTAACESQRYKGANGDVVGASALRTGVIERVRA
jgi:hypothetical protein